MADGNRDQDDIRQRVDQASGGEVVPGLEAEEEASQEASQPRRQPGRSEEGSEDPSGQPELTTEEQARAQTRRIEEMQRSGEGIHGVSTEARGQREAEDRIREAAEGGEGGEV